MPLNPISVGDAIASYIQANKPTDGVPVTPAQLQSIWEGIMTIIYNDLKANMGVMPGTFEVVVTHGSSAGTYPVTGVGGPAS